MLAKNTQFYMRKHNSVCQGLVLTLFRPGSFLLPGGPPKLLHGSNFKTTRPRKLHRNIGTCNVHELF